jgi:hypothetical protein
MKSKYWLFRFTSYSYCQGTRDSFYNDMRLLVCSSPILQYEAIILLKKQLKERELLEFDEKSIECITKLVKPL